MMMVCGITVCLLLVLLLPLLPLLFAPRIFFSPSLLRFLPSLPLSFLSPRRTINR